MGSFSSVSLIVATCLGVGGTAVRISVVFHTIGISKAFNLNTFARLAKAIFCLSYIFEVRNLGVALGGFERWFPSH